MFEQRLRCSPTENITTIRADTHGEGVEGGGGRADRGHEGEEFSGGAAAAARVGCFPRGGELHGDGDGRDDDRI